MNIFHHAIKNHYRFSSPAGLLTTEQLFDLPLKSKGGLDLDNVAKLANAELKAVTEESFVDAPSAGKLELENKLQIIKDIIAERQAENAAKLSEANRREEKAKLLGVLAKKQDAALEDLSPEELAARIAALG